MLKTYSENAILAKVRALYGRRLQEEDYRQLLEKKTVGEVAAYLKDSTYYAENLEEVKEELIHRGQLENQIRRRTLSTYIRLLRYTHKDALFLRLYVMREEIEQILTAIRLLNSKSIDRYIVSLPVYLAKMMSFDLFSIARARTFDDLLNILEHSPYQRIVGRFRPGGSRAMVDITSCEAALTAYYYGAALEIVDRDYSGDTRDALRKLLTFQLNLHNISVILRMRRYMNADREMILPRVVRVKGIRNQVADRLLEAGDLEEMQRILNSLPLLRNHPIEWEEGAHRLSQRAMQLRQDSSRKLFRFSTKPVLAVLTYMTLLEIEQSNIVHIVEGIRYGVPADELRKMICI